MINLIKGQRVEIDKGLTQLVVEMGWKVNPNAKPPYDLDASTFCLGESGQIENEYDFVYYNSPNKVQDGVDENGDPIMRPVSVDHSVLGSVDDLGVDEDNTGEGNEEIDVDLTKTASSIKEILSPPVYIGPLMMRIHQMLRVLSITLGKFVTHTFKSRTS